MALKSFTTLDPSVGTCHLLHMQLLPAFYECNNAVNYACVRGPYLGSILYQVDQVGALLDGDTPLALRGTGDLIAGAKAGQQGEEDSVSKHYFFSKQKFFENLRFCPIATSTSASNLLDSSAVTEIGP